MNSLSALRYAEAAARLGSFSAAARECGVAQPTVSAAVAELETSLGTPLFVRSGRRLEPTAAGARLLPEIAAVVGAVDGLRARARELTSAARHELRIGFSPLVGAARLALLLDPYRRQNPDTRMLFFESGVADLEQRLDAGRLDLVVGCGLRRVRTRKRLRLLSDPLALCSRTPAGPRDAVARLASVRGHRLLLTEDLCGLATVTRTLLDGAGVPIDAYPGRAMSYGALEDWVELGLGAAVIPWVHVRDKSLARALVDDAGRPLAIQIEAVWKSHLAAGEQGARFLTYLHRVVPTLARGLAPKA